MSVPEWQTIYEGSTESERFDRFYRQWALKEAFIKAIGSGLAFSPKRIEILGMDHTRRDPASRYENADLRIDGNLNKNWR